MQNTIPGVKVEIGGDVSTRKGISAKSGQPYEIHTQSAWLVIPGVKYPLQFDLGCEEAGDAKPIGSEWLLPFSALAISRYNDIEVRVRAADLVADDAASLAPKKAAS